MTRAGLTVAEKSARLLATGWERRRVRRWSDRADDYVMSPRWFHQRHATISTGVSLPIAWSRCVLAEMRADTFGGSATAESVHVGPQTSVQ